MIDLLSAKMKIRTPAFIALISMIVCGVGILGFLMIRSRPIVSGHDLAHQVQQSDSDSSAPISLSAALLLLAVGIAGVLGVSRKKNDNSSTAQHTATRPKKNDRDKAFVNLNKQYLNLQYQMTQHRICGDDPPDDLREEIFEIERKVKLIAKALE